MASPPSSPLGEPSSAAGPMPSVPNEFDSLCKECGYSLIAIASYRCPECGRPFDPGELPLARVPWLYRRKLGWLPAYWKTLWRIVFHPAAFARELCRPTRVSASDAQKFRALTIWHVVLPVVVGMGFAVWQQSSMRRSWIVVPASMALFAICGAWIGLNLSTDMPTFIWKGLSANRRNVASLHHYAAAPIIAFSPLILISFAVVAVADVTQIKFTDQQLFLLFIRFLGPPAVLAVLWSWIVPLIFMRTATRCGFWRLLILALYLPIHWVLVWSMVLIGFVSAAWFLRFLT